MTGGRLINHKSRSRRSPKNSTKNTVQKHRKNYRKERNESISDEEGAAGDPIREGTGPESFC